MTEVTSSKLKIAPVGLETNSNFTCIAVNEGGQGEPATLFINVNGKFNSVQVSVVQFCPKY